LPKIVGSASTLSVDEKTLDTLNQIYACFLAWESQVRVIGNVRAEDGANALRTIITRLAPSERARPAAPVPDAAPKANPREPEAFLVRFRGVQARVLWKALDKLTPGTRWSGCSKKHLANAWAAAGAGSSAYKQLADVTLDMIEGHLE
jgi:hypothetical protein